MMLKKTAGSDPIPRATLFAAVPAGNRQGPSRGACDPRSSCASSSRRGRAAETEGEAAGDPARHLLDPGTPEHGEVVAGGSCDLHALGRIGAPAKRGIEEPS